MTAAVTNPIHRLARYILLIAFAGLIFPAVTTALPTETQTGWVKLYDARTAGQKHNLYEIKGTMRAFPHGKLFATNVRTGPNATDPLIPDGSYYVTFWVEDSTGTEVEHKEEMEFKGGNTVNGLPLTVAGRITSCGVSYPP